MSKFLSPVVCLLVLIFSFAASSLRAAEGPPEEEQPKAEETQKQPAKRPFHNIRSEENWWDLGHPAESMKYVPLGSSGDSYLSFGGQVRGRVEFWDNVGFQDTPSRDDAFGLFRLRLHSDFYFGRHVRVFLEGKSAISTRRDLPGGTRTLDSDLIAAQQVLVDFRIPTGGDDSFTLRVGRQEIQFGQQRLVSPLDWVNTRPRAFDAVRGIWQKDGWRLDAFFGNQVQYRKYSYNWSDPDSRFYGANLAGKAGKTNLEFYWLGLDNQHAVALGGAVGSTQRQTLGAAARGPLGSSGADFQLEGAYQFGDHANLDVSAYMFASQLGYGWTSAAGKPRIYAGFDYASGDDNPADSKVGTFHQLYPLAHAFYGFSDAVARQNAVDLSFGSTVNPTSKLLVRLDLHLLSRASERDALYNAGGARDRGGAAGTDKTIGTNFDLTIRYVLVPGVVALGGYSRLWTGDFLKQTGSSDDLQFGHIGIEYTF